LRTTSTGWLALCRTLCAVAHNNMIRPINGMTSRQKVSNPLFQVKKKNKTSLFFSHSRVSDQAFSIQQQTTHVIIADYHFYLMPQTLPNPKLGRENFSTS
jgi:hypothetical protein